MFQTNIFSEDKPATWNLSILKQKKGRINLCNKR